MKLLILALDGLEYNLVNKFNISVFKQRMYGKHDVSVAVKPNDPLYTPLIWSSFLLGKPSYTYGFTMEYIEKRRGKAAYGFLYPLFKLRLLLFRHRDLKLRRFLMKIGVFNVDRAKRISAQIESLDPSLFRETFVGKLINLGYKVYYKQFPGLGDPLFSEYRIKLSEYYDKGLNERLEILEQEYDVSISLLDDALDNVTSNDLVLYYTSLLDHAHHLLYRPRNLKLMALLRSYYVKLSKAIEERVSRLKDIAILIVSDHGYDPSIHDHSNYGFWSININIDENLVPRTILDFHDLILEIILNK